MDTKILLENGTNELEVLEFVLDGNAYGINVAKVREQNINLFMYESYTDEDVAKVVNAINKVCAAYAK